MEQNTCQPLGNLLAIRLMDLGRVFPLPTPYSLTLAIQLKYYQWTVSTLPMLTSNELLESYDLSREKP